MVRVSQRLHSANTLKEGCAMVADMAPVTDRATLAEKIAVGTSKLTVYLAPMQ